MRQIDWKTDRQTLRDCARENGNGSGAVFVPVDDPPSAGMTIRVTVAFEGYAREFSFIGLCTSVRRKGRGADLPTGVTVEVPREHLAGLQKALAFARGEDVPFHERSHRRTNTELPARIEGSRGEAEVEVLDLSLGGARIAMEGELPAMGEEVFLTIEPDSGFFPLKVRGQVMWLSYFKDSRSLGFKFIGGGFGWKRKLAALVERVEAEAASAKRGGEAR
ncbi:MAG: PilZ domain-containing protein [Deltaproteobacteria bacterium]|nr:PilZ domain-containing protein [Deltaproteobacteria bacterium]